jgi:WbqC-like protein family
MIMRAVVLQSNYLPWRGYFDLIQCADIFVYYDEVQYTKNDWRNRNRIRSKNGTHWLTIPIDHGAVKQKVSEVRLPESSWQQAHFKSLYYSYRPAPYFRQIEPLLNEFYKARMWTLLAELNRYCIESIAGMLGITTRFVDSRSFLMDGNRVTRLVSLLQQIGATEYLSGPSARTYLTGSEAVFEQAGIRVLFKSYAGYPDYPQLRAPFDPQVSILDVLANVDLSDCRRCITGQAPE